MVSCIDVVFMSAPNVTAVMLWLSLKVEDDGLHSVNLFMDSQEAFKAKDGIQSLL